MSASQVVDCSASTDDDDGTDGYTYDELVRLHAQMTRQVHHITVEGLVEFRVNQHNGRIEVLRPVLLACSAGWVDAWAASCEQALPSSTFGR